MRVVFTLPGISPRLLAALMNALIVADVEFLQARPKTPWLYKSGVRYKLEPPNTGEDFAAIPCVLARGWADCAPLVAWRVAELRVRKRERAWWRWQRYATPLGPLYHIQVVRKGGRIEDPSKRLGMGGAVAA